MRFYKSHLHFNDVSGLDHEGVVIVGWVVANAVVKRDASRKGNATLELGPSLAKTMKITEN